MIKIRISGSILMLYSVCIYPRIGAIWYGGSELYTSYSIFIHRVSSRVLFKITHEPGNVYSFIE